MSTQQDIYAAGSENRPPMLNKENYVPWSSRLLRQMIPELDDADREVPVNETFHKQTNDELTEKELKHVETDDQAIQTILLGLPEDIYAAVDSWFTSTDGESIKSYYHHFSKLMNDFKRNKYFPEKIASNLKFLNNLQPEWSRHEVDDLRAERLAKTHDPLALMANSNNPFNYLVFHQDQPSSSTYMQHVEIKRLHDDLEVTAAKLMMLVYKLLLSVFRVNAAITKLLLLIRLRLLEDFLLSEKG
ncbi:hypothetical protein Tco_1339512 [Tanacetum coccineum]